MTLTFKALGVPAPQGSKRHMGNGILKESCERLAPWRSEVAHACHDALPPDWDPTGPYAVSIVCLFRRPAGHFGTGKNAEKLKPSSPLHPITRKTGDSDKLARGILDGVTEGGGLADDSQCVTLSVSKRYCEDNESPCALITLIPLSNEIAA